MHQIVVARAVDDEGAVEAVLRSGERVVRQVVAAGPINLELEYRRPPPGGTATVCSFVSGAAAGPRLRHTRSKVSPIT